MTQSASLSQPSDKKRTEALLALLQSGASQAQIILGALKNVDFINVVSLDDKAGPSANYILAAANVTRRASGIFVFFASWSGTDSAADAVSLVAAKIPGPTTAFSGGTVSAFKGTIRVAQSGAVTATGTGATVNVAVDTHDNAASELVGGVTTAIVNFTPGPVGQTNLILLQLNATHDFTGMTIGNIGYFELP